MASIRIILDRQNPVYKCGEAISGKIRLWLNAPMIISEVKISFAGKALVKWVVVITTEQCTATTPFTGSEDMVLPTITVWPVGGRLRNSTLSLLGGQHDFNFSFFVPTKLPNLALPGSLVTPLQGGEASIAYWLEARVVRQTVRSTVAPIVRSTDRPVGPPDLFATEQVVILEYYDLNTDPQASLPVAVIDDHSIECCLWWCCCCGGQIEVKVSLPKLGYAIGEFLGITWHSLEIINQSRKNVEQVQLQLIQTSTFTATEYVAGIFGTMSTNKSKSVTVLLGQTSKNQPLLPGQTQHWTNEGFVIPLVGTRPSVGCRIIKTMHHLAFNIVPDDCFSPFSVMVPVIIGSVPLTSSPAPGLPPPESDM